MKTSIASVTGLLLLASLAPPTAAAVATATATATSAAAATNAAAAPPANPKAGQLLYKQHCSRCHGLQGEGTKKHPEPLLGKKPLPELARIIDKTMPEDDPDKLDAAQSADVAAFIFDAFYSPSAQARSRRVRVELSRLTVGQYRNTIADLVGSFRGPTPQWGSKRGLHGEYFASRGFPGNKRKIDRTDSEVKFDFGVAAPNGKFESPHTFSIRWEGSVLPKETGVYEFIVRTEHAARLWINNPRKALIDAWVKSGNDNEYRGSIFLLAGRPYTVKLEFSKAKQGVDDSKKKKKIPPVKASIALLWRPPHAAVEVIPSRQLSPSRSPEAFVVNTRFPPDDRSMGWERGSTISKEWEAAATDAALETAGRIMGRLPELAGAPEGDPKRAAKLKAFAARFAERAFRRPLTTEDRSTFIERPFQSAKSPTIALKRSLVLVLLSPRFLYREVMEPETAGYAAASQLSYELWDAPPDSELLKAAAAGKLVTAAQLKAQAERMLADPRARAKIRAFLLSWLKIDQLPELAKDRKRFPGFDESAIADLRASLELFLDDVVWNGDSDFRQLLLGDHVYLTSRIAKLYGINTVSPEAGFQRVNLDPGKRAGVLTHPYVLSAFAYAAESSPIHRGVFVARGILGVTLHPPPDAFTPFSADLHPTLTTRERVALQTKPKTCSACHGVINSLGFSLENFDAIGRYREKEKGKPVDASGAYKTQAGKEVKFNGPMELARYLASSEEVHATFVEKMFHHLVKQPVRAYGWQRLEELTKGFRQNGFSIRKLIVEVAVAGALQPRPKK